MVRGIACVLLCGLILGGCSSGSDDEPLPGERIAIMALGQDLEPDPGLADLEVRLPAPYVNKGWYQAGGTSSHALHHLSLDEGPRIVWQADIGSGSSADGWILAQPLVADGRVYTMDAHTEVSAFDVESGKRIWRVELDRGEERGGYFGGGIAFEAGRVYVTAGFGMVFALNAEDGATVCPECGCAWQLPRS